MGTRAIAQASAQVTVIPPKPQLSQDDVAAIVGSLRTPAGYQEAIDRLQQAAAGAQLQPQQIETLRRILNDPNTFAPPMSADQRAAAAAMYVMMLGAGGYVYLAECDPREIANPRMSADNKSDSRARFRQLLQTTASVWYGGQRINGDFAKQSIRQDRLAIMVNMLQVQAGQQGSLNHVAIANVRRSLLSESELATPPSNDSFNVASINYAPSPRGVTRLQLASAPTTTSSASGANARSFEVPAAPTRATVRPQTRTARAATGPQPAGEADPGPLPGLPSASAPAASSQTVAPGEEQRRIVPPAQVHTHEVPGVLIPGTNQQWTAENVARYLEEHHGAAERQTVLTGLTLIERQRVAEAFARRRGQPYSDGQALAYLIQEMAGSGKGNNAQMFRDMLRPDNSEGFVSDHVLIHLDATGGNWLSGLTGIGGANHAAIERVIMHRTPDELREIDANMQTTYHKSLQQVVGEVEDREARERLLFLLNCPKRDALGEIPQAELQAWHLRETMHNFTWLQQARGNIGALDQTDWNGIYRTLGQMTERQVRAAAEAYYRQVTVSGQRPEGSAARDLNIEKGLAGPIEQSALGRALITQSRQAIRVAGGEDLAQARMTYALQGLAFDPNEAIGEPSPIRLNGESDQAFNSRVAEFNSRVIERVTNASTSHAQTVAKYVSTTIQLGEKQQLSSADVQGALTLIQRNVAENEQLPLNGQPLPQMVLAQFAADKRARGHDIPDDVGKAMTAAVGAVNNSVESRGAEANTRLLLAGDGENSPQGRAMQLVDTLSAPALGFAGPYRQRTYQLLDLRDVPEGQREYFRAKMRDQYAAITGRNMDADIAKGFGNTMNMPGGLPIQSQAVRLANRGILSNAERLIYALYEPGLMGLVRADNLAQVSEIVQGLTPLERMMTRAEFQRLTGRDLLTELNTYPGFDARLASVALRVSDSDVPMLAAQAQLYTNAAAGDPRTAQARAEALGVSRDVVNDFLAKNLYDQNGLNTLRQTIDASGGALAYAQSVADSPADYQTAVNAAMKKGTGNALMRGVVGLFGNNEEAIRAQTNKLNELARRAQAERQQYGSVLPETQSEMVFVVDDYKKRLIANHVDIGRASNLAENVAVTVAVVTAMAVSPELSALWVSVIAGATGVATQGALGQIDTPTQALGIVLRDMAKGYGAAQAAQIMNTVYQTEGISLIEEGLYGAVAGAAAGSYNAIARSATSPTLWRTDPAQGLADFATNYANDTGTGAIVGGASALVFGALRRAFTKDQSQTTSGTDRPDDPNNPTDRPVDPGTEQPTRPTDPNNPVDRPVDPGTSTTGPRPTRPGGDHNVSSTGSSSPVASRPSGSTNGTSSTGTTEVTSGRPGGSNDVSSTTTSSGSTSTTTQPSRDVSSTSSTSSTSTSSTTTSLGTTATRPGGDNSVTDGLVSGRGTSTGTSSTSTSTTSTGVTRTGSSNGVSSSTTSSSTTRAAVQEQTTQTTQAATRLRTDAGLPSTNGAVEAITAPGATRAVVVSMRSTSSTLDVATMSWAALAVAASTEGALAINDSTTDRLRKFVNATAPSATAELQGVLRQLSEPERHAEVARMSGAFAASALAYMQDHNGVLPPPENGPSEFNQALDLAWRASGLSTGRRTSRAEKIRMLISQTDGVAAAANLPTETGVSPGEHKTKPSTTGANPPSGANNPQGPANQGPASSQGPAAPGGTQKPRQPHKTKPGGKRPSTSAPTAPSTTSPAGPPPETVETLRDGLRADLQQIAAVQGQASPELYADASARLDRLRVAPGRSAAEYNALVGEYADLVRKLPLEAADLRLQRTIGIINGSADHPQVMADVYRALTDPKAQGRLTADELSRLGSVIAYRMQHANEPADPNSTVVRLDRLPIEMTVGLHTLQLGDPQKQKSYEPASLLLHDLTVRLRLNFEGTQEECVQRVADVYQFDLPFLVRSGAADLIGETTKRLFVLGTQEQIQGHVNQIMTALVDATNRGLQDRVGYFLQAASEFTDTSGYSNRAIAAQLGVYFYSAEVQKKIAVINGNNLGVALAFNQSQNADGSRRKDTPSSEQHPYLDSWLQVEGGRDALRRLRESLGDSWAVEAPWDLMVKGVNWAGGDMRYHYYEGPVKARIDRLIAAPAPAKAAQR